MGRQRARDNPTTHSGDARVDAGAAKPEQGETELPVERDMMHELHKEAEAFRNRLLRQYPESYVDQLFEELAEAAR